MKEKRFLELINLYIDGEIEPEERSELEAALQQSSRRKAVFEQYTRLESVSQCAFAKCKPSLTQSVDFHKYAELARNADQRMFSGFAYTIAAVILVAVCFVGAFRYADDLLPFVGLEGPSESLPEVQTIVASDLLPTETRTNVIETALQKPIPSGTGFLMDVSDSIADAFQGWENTSAKSSSSHRFFSLPKTSFYPSIDSHSATMSASDTIGTAPEMAGFRFQR